MMRYGYAKAEKTKPICVCERSNSLPNCAAAVLTFTRSMYVMQYMTHRRMSTFVVTRRNMVLVPTTCSHRVAVSTGGIADASCLVTVALTPYPAGVPILECWG